MNVPPSRATSGSGGDHSHPPGPFLLPSVEVRWFLEGDLPPALERWIDRWADPAASGSRTDAYVRLPDAPRTGIKLREGRIEVKTLRQRIPPSPAIPGWVEWWLKWSQPVPGGLGLLEGPGIDVVEVSKDRRAWFQDGVLREVTRVSRGVGSAWTVGLEAPEEGPGHLDRSEPAVPSDLAAAATQLFRLDGLSDILLPRRSASYPEWLSRR